MSDQGKFINTYIDVILGGVQELLNTTFQLKTQLKLSGEIVAAKDNEIAALKSQIENFSGKESDQILNLKTQINELISKENENISKLKSQVDNFASETSNKENLIRTKDETINRLENELNSFRTKQSHYDSAIKQIVDMKGEVKKRDAIIEEKDKEILDLKNQLETEKQKKIPVEYIKETKKPKTSSKLFDSVEINKTGTILAQKDDF